MSSELERQTFENEENLGKAEEYFILAGKWLNAVEMYESNKKFDQCVKVLKLFASDRETVERVKNWEGYL